MPWQDVGGVRLFYREAGAGPETLVLVHGNVASSRWWDLVTPELSRRYRVIAPDLRGFGQSGKPGEGYTVVQFARDLAALAEALQLPPAHFIGHSLGGSVVIQFALDHPAQVRSLVLVDPGPAEGQYTAEERYPLLAATATSREYMKLAIAGVTPLAPRDGFFETLVDDAMLAGGVLIPIARDLNAWNVQARLGEIKAPTLVLQGEKDALVQLDALQRTVAGIPGARLEMVPGVGHSCEVEAPAEFLRLIGAFLA